MKLRAEYWEVKARFTMGDYKISLEKANAQVKALLEKYPDLQVSAKKEEIILSLSDEANDPHIMEI